MNTGDFAHELVFSSRCELWCTTQRWTMTETIHIYTFFSRIILKSTVILDIDGVCCMYVQLQPNIAQIKMVCGEKWCLGNSWSQNWPIVWEYLCRKEQTSVSHQLQTASTESFFITFGHGSPPKISGVTGTAQDCWPTQYCTENGNDV